MWQILNESKKSLDVMVVVGLLPIPDLLHLIHTCVDTCIRYDVAERVHPLRVEVTKVNLVLA